MIEIFENDILIILFYSMLMTNLFVCAFNKCIFTGVIED